MKDTDIKDEAKSGSKPDGRKSSTEPKKPPAEIGGREGPDPVRYGDWEKAGRAIDF